MPRPPSEVLTERESQIMRILWRLGEANSEQVRQSLPGSPHDSTVRTLLRILKTKGYVRVDSSVRPALYRPAVAQDKVQRKAAKTLLQRFFGGSAEALVVRLLEDEELTPEQLGALRKSMLRRGRKGESP